MSGYNPTANANVQTIFAGTTLHNSFALFNNTLFVGADGNTLAAYSLNNGNLSWNPTSQSLDRYGTNYTTSGSSPVVSASGTANGVVWTLDNSARGSGPAVLYAYDARNLANRL